MTSHDDELLMVWLLNENDGNAPQRWIFPVSHTVQIGRNPENDIHLTHPKVSRYHASVFHDGYRWHCACFGSNGVFVGGRAAKQVELQSGLVLQFAKNGPKLLFEMPPTTNDEGRGSMTFLIDEIKLGDKQSARELWARCMATAVRLARQRLGPTGEATELDADVAASAFASLMFGNARRRIPTLSDRESLWELVVSMISQKADEIEKERDPQPKPSKPRSLEKFVEKEPTPESVSAIEQQTDRWLRLLPTDLLKEVAALRLEGYSVAEVADMQRRDAEAVKADEAKIREIWSQSKR
jgi:pSer/pThr/pTyr-binding forkhead associated (FHA) protein